ncbi:probable disease resistance protein At5g63020 [Humulus lupulus]|uniref:probable disease resistance protein At5g63020 n=1 Tax=Humulus lupulus TaxID=3486 RepID=UPI002B4106FF|nr:probable disease resistance protein At5g63020 [Humulus lupulus]XP_062105377.1 probable disease resistance protein At5g63020 [Humulus lupulus]XP_062105378.1 probable disease resistance protein At5g63020 [Humulus lupulus]
MGNCISISLPFDAIFSNCYQSTVAQATYVHNLKENLKALKKASEELTDVKIGLVRRVRIAEEEDQLTCLETVQRWISRAEALDNEVQELLQTESEERNRLCLWGCCSKNYKSSYKYGKRVLRKLAEVTDLKGEGVFEVVAERGPIALVVEVPDEPTVGMEPIFDLVWTKLNEEDVRIMGLYGMGGVGKTTLLRKINNNFLNSQNEYHVIWVVVSKDHTIEKIQNSIREEIRLSCGEDTWKKKTCQQKSKDIFNVLKKKKFILLLDDIWERIDLVEVGIPSPNRQNGSKLVFTTRSMEVCSSMSVDKQVEVKCLSWEESWKLFQEKVGKEALSVHPDILHLAKQVAKECGGLPLALTTIGRAMACKRTPQEWNYAIQILKNSASSFSGMGDKVFPLLKFSYDNLSSEKVRSCFLYCALFPEDWGIVRDDLIYKWMCEGLLDECSDFESLQGQGYTIIGSLLYACLLEEVNETRVKMHDVIRDMALWIACGCEKADHTFLVKTNVELKEPMIERWTEVERISLMKNRIESLSGSPSCPNLSTLFLQENKLRQVRGSFFKFIPKLTVLDLSENESLTRLPKEISKLVSLQYLNLASTSIKELPGELKNLKMMKYLNLDSLDDLNVIPEGVISSFSWLQVLHMFWCGTSSEEMVEDRVECGGNELLVQELESLKHIMTLGVSIKYVTALDRLLTSQMLLNSTQSLLLHFESTLQFLNLSTLSRMERLEKLVLRKCSRLEELNWEWKRREECSSHVPSPPQCSTNDLFLSLCEVRVYYCHNLKELTGLAFAPNLQRLTVCICSAVEEIIRLEKLGDAPEEVKCLQPFLKLESLTLVYLRKLKNIYPKPLPFPCLKEFYVRNCEELKKLPVGSTVTKMRPDLKIIGYESWWNELEWEDETTRDAFLPCFDANVMMQM